ncbi:hypothetical protein CTheo_5763 [Ceratobasidium theobromae]|uniref:Uncharacterized protein n=1 Tax=Ceratobasidium theobromae TaxID=1582974 RepID=A0A5N5QH63_9AGAM|nr:hypothetical protein CTheo_5762 [Ceratobasidium theobromae]KAB5590801.1 hypothetical protein CTheo_5763 [Ceratobasidium theobromae]
MARMPKLPAETITALEVPLVLKYTTNSLRSTLERAIKVAHTRVQVHCAMDAVAIAILAVSGQGRAMQLDVVAGFAKLASVLGAGHVLGTGNSDEGDSGESDQVGELHDDLVE